MRYLNGSEKTIASETVAVEGVGIAEWISKLVRSWRGRHDVQRRQIHLLETLALGGKRQLMLVSCDGENFLVGGGPDSIETVVRVRAESSRGSVNGKVDGICG
jgi:hypothetical protein